MDETWFGTIRRRLLGAWSRADKTPGRLRAEEWTIQGITFDTSGWQLVESSASRMIWKAPNGTLTLTAPEAQGTPPVTLTELRCQHRALARANREDIVEVDVVPLREGEALQVICKRTVGPGCGYRGLLELHGTARAFRIESDIDEGNNTGSREAIVNAMRVSLGEFALGPVNADGSRRILGLLHDPYDPAFDEDALNSVSDDERLDAIMPAHPLSRTRALLRTVASSIAVAGTLQPVTARPTTEPEPGTARRRELSASVVTDICDAAGRHDLVEQALQEEIAEWCDTPTPRLAASLLHLGALQHMGDRPRTALPMLSRAERLFIELAGEDAPQTVLARTHHACALLKTGDHAQALPRFLRAIEAFEKHPPDDGTYALALAGAGEILGNQGQESLAAEYLGRAQRLLERIYEEAP